MLDYLSLMEKDQTKRTTNGLTGYETSGSKLVDLNFKIASLRNRSDDVIISAWIPAFMEDRKTAMRWLFFLRDVRGGMGERRIFRVILKWLANNNPEMVHPILTSRSSFTLNNGPLIPYFGRWDDLLCLIDTPMESTVMNILANQLQQDIINMKCGKSISLLVKWLPSYAGVKARVYTAKIRRAMKMSTRKYQSVIKELRHYSNVLESKISRGRWDKVDYETVPSNANLRYMKAFMRHDYTRRKAYLDSLARGEKKIKANTVFPYEIYAMISGDREQNIPLNAMWDSLSDLDVDVQDTIVVCDSSGSMSTSISKYAQAIDVSESLAIYFAERMKGPYKNKFITFSTHPQIIDFSGCETLIEKHNLVRSYAENANTNIMAVFELILSTAIKEGIPDDQIPRNVMIISDMEFDYYAGAVSRFYDIPEVDFEVLSNKYKAKGYTLPRLIFWNVTSRTNTIPMKTNENGIALLSGFSPMIAKIIVSGKLDPYGALMDAIMVPRYQVIADALSGDYAQRDCDYNCNECTRRS